MATGENQLADHPPHETAVHREPGFRRLWAANFSDEAGSQFSAMAMQVTAVSVLGASTLQLGVLTALGRVAYLVIGIPAGAWVDRWRKKQVMILWGLVRAAAVASVAAAYLVCKRSLASETRLRPTRVGRIAVWAVSKKTAATLTTAATTMSWTSDR
ncbi:hypothetical protein [Georgenia daeguensis]|uniref:MFS transporter n=1 Tax=Georgenia daeguensis TaxID=908355 RepID=A0ABP6UKS5_9MICO